MEKKYIAISDIHGKLYLLQELFNKLQINKQDTIIFLGDYIDRGEDSRGVINFIINLQKKYKVITLKGNHEQFAIEGKENPESNMACSWFMNGGINALQSYDEDLDKGLSKMFEEHGDFFKSLQLTYETENHIFVHGWLDEDLDADKQNEFACLWNRYEDIKPHKSGKTVVCGHSIQIGGFSDEGFKICIDTGGFLEEGCITAMIVDGNKVSFVDSR